jgi:pyruvate kinase
LHHGAVTRDAIPRTKLVCTIGPASRDHLDELVGTGMSVARVNLAHGDRSDHETSIRAVRAAADRAGRDVAVLVDLPGPKLRLGHLRGGEVQLETGQTFTIGPDQAGDEHGATATHALAADLLPGDRVLLADGAAELRVTGSTTDTLQTVVELGGLVRSRAGVAVPAERLSLPALTPEDSAALPWLLSMGVDLIGLSFVRAAHDVDSLRQALAALDADARPAIVAKIETRPAVADAEAIVRAADALMIARGDLGVELPYEEVPLIQKHLIRTALRVRRPVIVATQMLESMTTAARPTRAEASDVANAVFDGADAVMLSAETAIGAYPIEAATAALRIAAAAEAEPLFAVMPVPVVPSDDRDTTDAEAVALAAVEIARQDPAVDLLACFTRSGRTATLLAALRPGVPIVAFSPSTAVRRRLALWHGVRPLPIADIAAPDVEGTLAQATLSLPIATGRAVVLVATAAGQAGRNVVEVVRRQGDA